jgi:hypothetical protein
MCPSKELPGPSPPDPAIFNVADRAVELALSRRFSNVAKYSFSENLFRSRPADPVVLATIDKAVKLALSRRLSKSTRVEKIYSAPDPSSFHRKSLDLTDKSFLEAIDTSAKRELKRKLLETYLINVLVTREEQNSSAFDVELEMSFLETIDSTVKSVLSRRLSELYAINISVTEETNGFSISSPKPSSQNLLDPFVNKSFAAAINEAVKRVLSRALSELDIGLIKETCKEPSDYSWNKPLVLVIDEAIKRALTRELSETGRLQEITDFQTNTKRPYSKASGTEASEKLPLQSSHQTFTFNEPFHSSSQSAPIKSFYEALTGKCPNADEEVFGKSYWAENSRKNDSSVDDNGRRDKRRVRKDEKREIEFVGEGSFCMKNDYDNTTIDKTKILIRPKKLAGAKIDILAEIENTTVDRAPFEIDHAVLFPPSGAALFSCKTEEGADNLRKFAAQSDKIDEVKFVESFPRRVWICNIEAETTDHEIHYNIYAKYGEVATNIRFSRLPWTENLKVANIEVGELLFRKMETSPYIRIRWRDHEIDTSVDVNRCSRCWLLGHREKFCQSAARKYPIFKEGCLDCAYHNECISEVGFPFGKCTEERKSSDR